MIYQQVTSAVKEAYRDDEELGSLFAQAQACRLFLQSLKIDPKLSGPIVEPITYIEEAFRELLVAQEKKQL